MGLARQAGLPAIVVGDIDRGGVFAALFGTVALLGAEDQALVAGFVINKFRGDPGLLQPGLDMITAVTGRPVHGVLPFHRDVWLDAEDSLAYGRVLGRPAAPRGDRVAAGRGGPAAADLERHRRRGARRRAGRAGAADRRAGRARRRRPGRAARLEGDGQRPRLAARRPAWPTRSSGTRPPASRCSASAAASRCSAGTIDDEVESGRGTVPGLGLLPVDITFGRRKTLARSVGLRARRAGAAATRSTTGTCPAASPSRCCATPTAAPRARWLGNVSGTHWHGAFESDEFRRRFLTEAARPGRPARVHGRAGHPVRGGPRACPGRARRPGRGAPGHRRAVAADRTGPAQRPAVRAPGCARCRLRRASRGSPRTSWGCHPGWVTCGWSPWTGPAGPARPVSRCGWPRSWTRPVVHTDDLLDGWDDQFTFWDAARGAGARAAAARARPPPTSGTCGTAESSTVPR